MPYPVCAQACVCVLMDSDQGNELNLAVRCDDRKHG